jgi:hypothetical protein
VNRSTLRRRLVLLALGCGAAALEGAVPSWHPVGPPGGPPDAVVVDPVHPATVYVGSELGGVFKSIDRGESWARSSAGLSDSAVNVLAVDPRAPSTRE